MRRVLDDFVHSNFITGKFPCNRVHTHRAYETRLTLGLTQSNDAITRTQRCAEEIIDTEVVPFNKSASIVSRCVGGPQLRNHQHAFAYMLHAQGTRQ